MKTFKEFLTEELMPKVHYNTNLNVIKSLASNSKGKQARYALMSSGELRGGDAYEIEHRHLTGDEDSELEGFINSNSDGSFSHKSFEPGSSKRLSNHDHKFFSNFDKYKIKNIVTEVFHDSMPSPYKAHKGELVDIWKNPSRGEVDKIVNTSESKNARAILHGDDCYVFDAMKAIHCDVVDHLKIPSVQTDHFTIGRDRIGSEYVGHSPNHITRHPWVSSTLSDKRFFAG